MSTLHFAPILENPTIVSESVLHYAQSLPDASTIMCAEIDPKFMGGKELAEEYGLVVDEGANCVIVQAIKGDVSEFVAVLVPVGYRADLNGFVRKYLDVKRISLAPLQEVLDATGMEYGSITPFGLPSSWKILVDSRLMQKEKIVVGGGKQISKLLLPTAILKDLPNVKILEGLSNPLVI